MRVMFGLPTGNMYINSVDENNSVMITDIRSYDEFICECGVILKIIKNDNIKKFIYKDNVKSYEITLENYLHSTTQ